MQLHYYFSALLPGQSSCLSFCLSASLFKSTIDLQFNPYYPLLQIENSFLQGFVFTCQFVNHFLCL